jgi:hypothetical protein
LLVSADLLGQGDDDARGAAEVAEQEGALVLCDLAEEFGAVGAQAVDGVVDVVDREYDAIQAQRGWPDHGHMPDRPPTASGRVDHAKSQHAAVVLQPQPEILSGVGT